MDFTELRNKQYNIFHDSSMTVNNRINQINNIFKEMITESNGEPSIISKSQEWDSKLKSLQTNDIPLLTLENDDDLLSIYTNETIDVLYNTVNELIIHITMVFSVANLLKISNVSSNGFSPMLGRIPTIKDAEYFVMTLNDLINNPFDAYTIFNTIASHNLLTQDIKGLLDRLVQETMSPSTNINEDAIVFMLSGLILFQKHEKSRDDLIEYIEVIITNSDQLRDLLKEFSERSLSDLIQETVINWNSGAMRNTLPSKTTEIIHGLGAIVDEIKSKQGISVLLGERGTSESEAEEDNGDMFPTKKSAASREESLGVRSTDIQFRTVRNIATKILKVNTVTTRKRMIDNNRLDIWDNMVDRAVYFLYTAWPEFDSKNLTGNPPCKCYICNGIIEPIEGKKPNELKPYMWQVEHVMPFAYAVAYTGIAPSSKDLMIGPLGTNLINCLNEDFADWVVEDGGMAGRYFNEYAPSHKCCNQIKGSKLFLKFTRKGFTFDKLPDVLGNIYDNIRKSWTIPRINSNCRLDVDVDSNLRKANAKRVIKREDWIRNQSNSIKDNYLNYITEDVKIHKTSTQGGLDDVIRFSKQISNGLGSFVQSISEDEISSAFIKREKLETIVGWDPGGWVRQSSFDDNNEIVWKGEPMSIETINSIENLPVTKTTDEYSSNIEQTSYAEMFIDFSKINIESYLNTIGDSDETKISKTMFRPDPQTLNYIKDLFYIIEKCIFACRKFFSKFKYFKVKQSTNFTRQDRFYNVNKQLKNGFDYICYDIPDTSFGGQYAKILKRLDKVDNWPNDISNWIFNQSINNITEKRAPFKAISEIAVQIQTETIFANLSKENEKEREKLYIQNSQRWSRLNGVLRPNPKRTQL